MACTNELSYLREDDDKSIELVLYMLYLQLMHIKYYYYYLFTQLLIASDALHACINNKNRGGVCNI